MGQKIIVGPLTKGLRNDIISVFIDNDSFPVLKNAYQWRGRVKRKRGTSFLTRLRRYFLSTSTAYNSGTTTITLNGSGVGNILTGFSLQISGNVEPGTVTITAPGPTVYTDPAMDGTLSPSGSINYSTGVITILAEAGNTVSVSFFYYPGLPVLGLRDLILNPTEFTKTLGFDTKYSYNIQTTQPYNNYDVSFYKNPPVSASLPGYIPKTTVTPTTWNGQTYQQFWTTNYQGAFWATNGINIPFNITNVGMQFKVITNVKNIVAGPPATAQLTITAHGLVVGDFVFINEVVGVTGINFQTGYVIEIVDANNVSVEFPNATLGGAYSSGGIAQYLTNRSDVTKDCIRFYDGDPTNGTNANPPVLTGGKGWVNFCPPLSFLNYAVSESPLAQYYLVGARLIFQFKDRLLFFGPVIQTSSTGSQIYLQDTVIYSLNGTPYYTASFTGDVLASDTVFFPILTPTNQTAIAPAFFEDQAGFGGYVQAGLAQPIISVGPNEDVLMVGFSTLQTRLVYTGNDVIPFQFYLTNSELGTTSTFSSIVMDQGVISKGSRGYVISAQNGTQRTDLEIPDEIFQVNLASNGNERFTAARDYINEWIYFTYPSISYKSTYPNETLLYNYRDNTYAKFLECYTTYGAFRRQTGLTWATVGDTYPTWQMWNDPWNAGTTSILKPEVIAGNQQGFVLIRDEGTGESVSLSIQSISGNTVTSLNHTLNNDDFVILSGAIGTIASQVNGKVFKVFNVTINTFMVDADPVLTGTYVGGGLITRLYVPYIQTKQFPSAWAGGKKTRLGPQQYLLTKTEDAQITLLMFLSQNDNSAYNEGPIVPEPNSVNNSLIYSTILYTCPESTNIGLTPANSNLNTPTASSQSQIWHRKNTSLIGDTVQLAFTISDEQMKDENYTNSTSEVEIFSFILDVSPSQLLC